MAIEIESTAFAEGGEIPVEHTCVGKNVSPPLSWSGLPEGTKSLVLFVDDPDAPKKTWVHWVVYDLPPSVSWLPEDVGKSQLPGSARQGKNDWGRLDYGGPCPPSGRHRYFHKLYALDTELGDLGSPTKAEVEKAMGGHILGSAQLVGTFEKP